MMYMVMMEIRTTKPEARDKIMSAMKDIGHWSNRFETLWLVEPYQKMSATQLRDRIKPHMSTLDSVFVAQIHENWAGRHMGLGFPEWMARRSFK